MYFSTQFSSKPATIPRSAPALARGVRLWRAMPASAQACLRNGVDFVKCRMGRRHGAPEAHSTVEVASAILGYLRKLRRKYQGAILQTRRRIQPPTVTVVLPIVSDDASTSASVPAGAHMAGGSAVPVTETVGPGSARLPFR